MGSGFAAIELRALRGVEDPPLRLTVFSDQTTFAEAMIASGFETDEDGKGLWPEGGHGSLRLAEPLRLGRFSGFAGHSFFRGFIRDEDLRSDESPVYSGDYTNMVLRNGRGRPIAFECFGCTPEEGGGYEPALERIARTLNFLSGGGLLAVP